MLCYETYHNEGCGDIDHLWLSKCFTIRLFKYLLFIGKKNYINDFASLAEKNLWRNTRSNLKMIDIAEC